MNKNCDDFQPVDYNIGIGLSITQTTSCSSLLDEKGTSSEMCCPGAVTNSIDQQTLTSNICKHDFSGSTKTQDEKKHTRHNHIQFIDESDLYLRKRPKAANKFEHVSSYEYERAAQLLERCTALLIAAGAGMSLDSGLPDYRNPESWEKSFPLLAANNLSYECMARECCFHDKPCTVWSWYKHRFDEYQATQPHEGYHILHNWAREKVHGFKVFTSNVDGFFARSGFPRANIVECHGSLNRLQCISGKHGIWKSVSTFRNLSIETMCRKTGLCFTKQCKIPKCRSYGCELQARPNILLFGDKFWESANTTIQKQIYQEWLSTLPINSVLGIIEVGVGQIVPTVHLEVDRIFHERLSRGLETHVIRINPEGPVLYYPGQHVVIRSKALDALRQIQSQITTLKK
eukprot:gene1922-5011_t